MHRDVKSPNYLVASDLTVKITDLGEAIRAASDDPNARDGVGKSRSRSLAPSIAPAPVTMTPRWTAPETIAHAVFSRSSDCYSLALVVWEVRAARLVAGSSALPVGPPKPALTA